VVFLERWPLATVLRQTGDLKGAWKVLSSEAPIMAAYKNMVLHFVDPGEIEECKKIDYRTNLVRFNICVEQYVKSSSPASSPMRGLLKPMIRGLIEHEVEMNTPKQEQRLMFMLKYLPKGLKETTDDELLAAFEELSRKQREAQEMNFRGNGGR
jgi:hypothetical protein